MNKKNILIISLGYLPTVGGSYRVLHELITRQSDINFTVLTCKHRQQKSFDLNQNYKIIRSSFLSIISDDAPIVRNFTSFNLIKLPYFKAAKKLFIYFLLPMLSLLRIGYELICGKYDCIVFAQSVLPFAWYISFIKLFSKKKIITFVYGEDIVCYRKSTFYSAWFRKIYLRGLSNTDIIVANSSVTKLEILSDNISENKITIVYPAIDYEFFKSLDKEISRESFSIDKNCFVLLSVGRIIRRKGFDSVLKQIPELLKEIPNLLYIIRGEGYDKQYLEEIISKSNIEKYVRFINDLPYEELPSLYSAADIFILPNRLDERDNEQEGFGIVFLEANACGIPVIGGNSGGVVDIIKNGENGYLVSNETEICNCIMALRNNCKSNEFYSSYSIDKYNWDNSANKFFKIFQNS